ncbi:hypothetical protein EMN47_14930 [Prolixibacteraceae bacterium JC049]|nr:hypothetical protein [Prolixibacteraceae bacterium JC049]
MIRKITLLFIFLLAVGNLFAQHRTHPPFKSRVESHVHKYLLLAPGMMGPNALPVPEIGNGTIGDKGFIEFGAHSHFLKNDNGVNSFARFYFPIVANLIAIDVWGYPTESFEMSNERRDELQIYYDDTGVITQGGDLWLATSIQLVRNHKWLPNMVGKVAVKTTTGNLDHARYTDSPAQYFQLSTGKKWGEVEFNATGGFYVWQTNREEVSQDEGLMWGAELRWKPKNLEIYQSVSGYHAYEQTGHNKPAVLKSGIKYNWKKYQIGAEYQTGIQDYHYETARLSFRYFFSSPFKAVRNN